LLLLASAARPGDVEAATVDHGLRPESKSEAQMVAGVCAELRVPHSTLTARWTVKPDTAIQERARTQRYRLLGGWALERGLAAIATAHHVDDQAETLLMRLNRGSGARGLAGMRNDAPLPGDDSSIRLIRPLLDWRRSDLTEICRAAGVTPVEDPSNADEQFERVRVRRELAGAPWLDSEAIARSATNLASANEALDWATDLEWERQVSRSKDGLAYTPSAPVEIRRRILCRVLAELASEGRENHLRGRELDRLLDTLSSGGKVTMRGVLCSGGDQWRFVPAPRRR
jgi:tRNA(Ile)-lysidine synthase